MAPKRAAPTGDEVVRKSSRATKAAVVDDSNSENSQDEAPAPKKKAGKKPVKKTKKAKDESEEEDDDASDFEEAAAPVKKARGPPKEKVVKVEVAKLAVGDKVEDVTLQNENGEDVLLSSLYSAGGLILFSYPKANTPGCTSQACLFRDTFDDITATGFAISGLSQDKPAAQLARLFALASVTRINTWKTKNNFQYGLLSDPKSELLLSLGQPPKTKRCHWIISKEGILLEIAIGVKPADDATKALEFIKAL